MALLIYSAAVRLARVHPKLHLMLWFFLVLARNFPTPKKADAHNIFRNRSVAPRTNAAKQSLNYDEPGPNDGNSTGAAPCGRGRNGSDVPGVPGGLSGGAHSLRVFDHSLHPGGVEEGWGAFGRRRPVTTLCQGDVQ